MATVIESSTRSEQPPATDTVRRPGSRIVLAIAFVVVGLLGFGLGWLAFRDAGTDVPDEIEQLTQDFNVGWNAGDGDGVVAAMAPGGRHYYRSFRDGVWGDELADMVDRLGVNDRFEDFETETVIGDDPYVVVQRGTVYGTEGYSVFHIREVDGELRIDMHYWVD